MADKPVLLKVEKTEAMIKKEAAKAKVEELKAKANAVTLSDIRDMLVLIFERLPG